jgi:hypothetical protein
MSDDQGDVARALEGFSEAIKAFAEPWRRLQLAILDATATLREHLDAVADCCLNYSPPDDENPSAAPTTQKGIYDA